MWPLMYQYWKLGGCTSQESDIVALLHEYKLVRYADKLATNNLSLKLITNLELECSSCVICIFFVLAGS